MCGAFSFILSYLENGKKGLKVSPLGVPSLDDLRKRFSRFYTFYGFNGFNGVGAAHKNREVPRSFDSASRRRHRKRYPRSFLHSGQYHIGAASKQRLGATYFCFHTSFVYRSCKEDFSTSLEMTIRVPDVSQSPVTSHESLETPNP